MCDKTKLYLNFLHFLLPTINAFNTAFQATTYTTIHQLHPEMNKLTKRILCYFVNASVIDIQDITNTPFIDINNQLSNDQLKVGEKARELTTVLSEEGFEEECDMFFNHVRTFYTTFLQTLIRKFPFKSPILRDLRILNPAERRNWEDFPAAVVRLAKQFPQLGLNEGEKLEKLKTEAIDFFMADPAELPLADPTELPHNGDVNTYWEAVHEIKEMGSTQPQYSNLLVLVRALLALPASNADSERCFSMIRKIDGEERNHLERSTVAALLSLKLNVDEECYEYKPPTELLQINKSAVWKYNQDHGSRN